MAHWRRQFIVFGALGLLAAALANWLIVTYNGRNDLAALQNDSISAALGIAERAPLDDIAVAWAGGDGKTEAVQRLNAFLWSQIWSDSAHAAVHLLGPHRAGSLRLVASAHKDQSLAPAQVWPLQGTANWSAPRIGWGHDGERPFFRVFIPVMASEGQPAAVLALDRSPQEIAGRRQRLLISMLIGLGLFALLWLGQAYWLAFVLSVPVDRLANASRAIRGHGGTLVPTEQMGDLRPAAELINELTWASLERNRLHEALSKYVSHDVADSVAENPEWLTTRGRECNISILFADIYQFTELSQTMPTDEVVDMLNRCFTAFAVGVHRYNGMIDKFMGDGMMALFGALINDERHEEHAVLAALAMQDAVAHLRQDLQQPSLRIGVGVNSGKAIVGNIGSEDRFQFTAIGPAVNLAARLESFAHSTGGGVIVGYETAQKLGPEFQLERIDGARVKGLDQLLSLYRVKGYRKD